MDLMIVESPKKAKQIAGFFPNMKVIATIGHIRELPVSEMGVEPPSFIPKYSVISSKSDQVGRLRKAANDANIIYIATDTDREGEAIGWHVCQLLGKAAARKSKRIRYSAITKKTISDAMDQAGELDLNLVRAQEARRIIDRLVGYMVSPALYKILKRKGVSAGRVQSVALKLLCLRANERKNFESKKHYSVRAFLTIGDQSFHADWVFKKHLEDGAKLMMDEALAQSVKARTHTLVPVTRDVDFRKVKPLAPLITSELIIKSSELFKINAKQAMRAAQELFEQGLITYHRTDSPVIDPEFVKLIRDYAKSNGLPVPDSAPIYKPKGGAQEAHECIRVTDIELLSPRYAAGTVEYTVYQYIWFRTLVSQLEAGQDRKITQTFHNDCEEKDAFVAVATTVERIGWRDAERLILNSGKKKHKTDEEQSNLPSFDGPQPLPVKEVKLLEKSTQPPVNYTEASLVKKLEADGVGRPSTYASIFDTLYRREYAVIDKNHVVPTDFGHLIFDLLEGQYQFMNVDYTADMESDIDGVAQGSTRYQEVVSKCFDTLSTEMEAFVNRDVNEILSHHKLPPASTKSYPRKNITSKKPRGKAGDSCPTCSKGTLAIRVMKNGKNSGKKFLGCTNFPDCKHFEWHNS